jgi:hypothetical protein
MKITGVFLSSIIFTTLMFFLINIAYPNSTTFAIDTDTNSFLTYNNSKLKFSIQYPSTWIITENKLHPDLENISNTIEIKTPFEDSQDLLQEEFVISINKLQGNISFDDYVDTALKGFKNEYTDFKLISNNSTMIDNHNGRKLSYSYLAGVDPASIKLIMEDNIIRDGNNVYVLSFGTPPDKYYQYLSIIHKMINSFKILE